MVFVNILNVVAPKRLDGTMTEYLDTMTSMRYCLLLASTPSQELEHRSKLFMLLALHELLVDYSHVPN